MWSDNISRDASGSKGSVNRWVGASRAEDLGTRPEGGREVAKRRPPRYSCSQSRRLAFLHFTWRIPSAGTAVYTDVTSGRRRFGVAAARELLSFRDRAEGPPVADQQDRRPTNNYTMARPPVQVSDSQRRLLNSWIRAGTTPQRVVTRARIVLMAAEGKSARTIASTLKVNPRTVTLWRQRYDRRGPHILWHDAPGRGRKRSIDAEAVMRLRTLLASPAPGGGQWSVRRLAEVTGLSRSSVHRLLSSAGSVASRQQGRARALLITARRVAVANSETAPAPSPWALDFE